MNILSLIGFPNSSTFKYWLLPYPFAVTLLTYDPLAEALEISFLEMAFSFFFTCSHGLLSFSSLVKCRAYPFPPTLLMVFRLFRTRGRMTVDRIPPFFPILPVPYPAEDTFVCSPPTGFFPSYGGCPFDYFNSTGFPPTASFFTAFPPPAFFPLREALIPIDVQGFSLPSEKPFVLRGICFL